MASYFDEHDCEPLTSSEAAERMDFISVLRLMLQNNLDGNAFDQFLPLGERLAPPASSSVVASLPRRTLSDVKDPNKANCPVCLGLFLASDVLIEMPCEHYFHNNCILPWLNKTNSCPLCRYELKTDDKSYEEYKKFKLEEAERKAHVEELHNSMFG